MKCSPVSESALTPQGLLGWSCLRVCTFLIQGVSERNILYYSDTKAKRRKTEAGGLIYHIRNCVGFFPSKFLVCDYVLQVLNFFGDPSNLNCRQDFLALICTVPPPLPSRCKTVAVS